MQMSRNPDTKKGNDDALDLYSLLQKSGEGLAAALERVPEEKKPAVLEAYVQSELAVLEGESARPPLLGRTKDDGVLLEERNARFLEALELAFAQGPEAYRSFTLPGAASSLDAYLRATLAVWERTDAPAQSPQAPENRRMQSYFGILAQLQEIGYALPEREAAQLILDGLEASLEKEASRLKPDLRGDEPGRLKTWFNHNRIERAADAIDFLEARGAGGGCGKDALLGCLYNSFTFPREHYTFDWDSSEKVILISEKKARATMEERFGVLGRLETRGYLVDYQKVADNYADELSPENLWADSKSGGLRKCSKEILSRLEWLEGNGADLSGKYAVLSKAAIGGINGGSEVKGYLPLLRFLTGKKAFDEGQLELLRALSREA